MLIYAFFLKFIYFLSLFQLFFPLFSCLILVIVLALAAEIVLVFSAAAAGGDGGGAGAGGGGDIGGLGFGFGLGVVLLLLLPLPLLVANQHQCWVPLQVLLLYGDSWLCARRKARALLAARNSASWTRRCSGLPHIRPCRVLVWVRQAVCETGCICGANCCLCVQTNGKMMVIPA